MQTLRWLTIPLLLALALAGACKGEDKPAATYTARGAIKTMPGPDDKMYIHHESIPEFVGRSGKTAGMASMTMPFAVEPGVSLDGLTAGDKVEFTFAVHWARDTPTHITAIRKLPPETELELSGM